MHLNVIFLRYLFPKVELRWCRWNFVKYTSLAGSCVETRGTNSRLRPVWKGSIGVATVAILGACSLLSKIHTWIQVIMSQYQNVVNNEQTIDCAVLLDDDMQQLGGQQWTGTEL